MSKQTITIGTLQVEIPVWLHDPYSEAEIEAMRMKPGKPTVAKGEL